MPTDVFRKARPFAARAAVLVISHPVRDREPDALSFTRFSDTAAGNRGAGRDRRENLGPQVWSFSCSNCLTARLTAQRQIARAASDSKGSTRICSSVYPVFFTYGRMLRMCKSRGLRRDGRSIDGALLADHSLAPLSRRRSKVLRRRHEGDWRWHKGHWYNGYWHKGWWGPAFVTGAAVGAFATCPSYDRCWVYQPTYDDYGNYLGNQCVNVCRAGPTLTNIASVYRYPSVRAAPVDASDGRDNIITLEQAIASRHVAIA